LLSPAGCAPFCVGTIRTEIWTHDTR